MADAAAAAPGVSIPERAGNSAALEGTYRLLENERVSPEAVLDAHVQRTVARARAQAQVLVIHDTTQFQFNGEKRREGLGWLHHQGRQGFFGHFSFCVTPAGRPLGTLGLYVWRRQGEPKQRRGQRHDQFDPNRESLRWQDAALRTGELLLGKTQAVHVMDREGDNYELLSLLVEHEQRFVIRLCHDRRLTSGRSDACEKLFASLSRAPFFFERQVSMSVRTEKKGTGKPKGYPARASRRARLEVRAECKEIFVGNGAPAHLPPALKLGFVVVREVDVPEGEEPVVWHLVTTEPISTKEQVATVVDAYCRRWVIEEFFKAVKTGCRYEERQLESARSLLVDLAIETALGWRLLLLRWLAHHQPGAPASDVLTAVQIAILVALSARTARPLPANPDVASVLDSVATLGGHIKNNGPPGWLVLRRGFEKLLTMEVAWEVARQQTQSARCDQ